MSRQHRPIVVCVLVCLLAGGMMVPFHGPAAVHAAAVTTGQSAPQTPDGPELLSNTRFEHGLGGWHWVAENLDHLPTGNAA